jgi:DNA-binding beta-propeller fold protein YncE
MLAEKLRAASSGVSDPAWNLNSAVYQGSPINFFSVFAQEGTPQDVFFKPDGLKMYVVGSSSDNVNEYNLSTAWDISTASYLQAFSVAAQENNPEGIFFKPDGLKMYIIGGGGDDVNEYNLSTAWDISTASYLQLFSVAAQQTSPTGVFFKDDGLKMYMIGLGGTDAVYQYDLSTAWDVSTASYLQSFVVNEDTASEDIFFKPDGLQMYTVGSTNESVYQDTLSTAWDISTSIYVRSFSVLNQESSPQGLFFKPDGLKMYVTGTSSDAIWSYDFV